MPTTMYLDIRNTNRDHESHPDTYAKYLRENQRPVTLPNGDSFTLYPGLHQERKRQFTRAYQYDKLQAYAQQVSQLNHMLTPAEKQRATKLKETGYTRLNLLSPEKSAHWHSVIEAGFKGSDNKDFVQPSNVIREDDTLLTSFLEDIITTELERVVSDYFSSHFSVMYAHFSRTLPYNDAGERNDVSFRWHVDQAVPEEYLKVFFYLNDYEEHGGGTHFASKQIAEQLGEIGYTNAPMQQRREDLAPLCDHFGIAFESECVRPKAGEAVLFQPANTLHKGMAPTKGVRYVGQLGLIPGMQHWRSMLSKNMHLVKLWDHARFPRVVMQETDEVKVAKPSQPAPQKAVEAPAATQPAPAFDDKPFITPIQPKANSFWKEFHTHNALTIQPHDHLTKDSKIFAMGSCFAVEIRKALRAASLDVYPKYLEIPFDAERIAIGGLPYRDNLNHYHTFAIRQEFEKFHGKWMQEIDDIWEIDDRFWKTDQKIYQDPYRRSVYGRTPEELHSAIRLLDEKIHEGMQNAEIFLITLGLIEVWRKKRDGRFSCEFPGYNLGGGFDETEFHLSTFQENYENMKEVVHMIRAINKNAQIVLTVSPVWLGRTFTENDVYVANMESKSLLRTVAGQITREEQGVHYFPSYEIATALKGKGHAENGRHVADHTIYGITDLFMRAHSGGKLSIRKQQPTKQDSAAKTEAA